MGTRGRRSLPDRLQELYRRRTFGIKPGLEATKEVLEALGNPQQACGVIHIAGTNGKGSVAALIASLMRQLGVRVGLYTSPHLVSFAERFQVDGGTVAEECLEAALVEVHAAEVACGRELTFFECATAMAWVIFRARGVSLAVVETGLGGRLDATNVVEPLVSVITRIDMDHGEWLGDDLASVAMEKAGIIKAGRPVVSAPQLPDAAAVLAAVARERGCRLVSASEHVSVGLKDSTLGGQKISISTSAADYGQTTLSLLGEWQLENVSVAVAAAELMCDMLGVTLQAEQVQSGVARVCWPGRMERVHVSPTVLFDAAHNPLGARVLVHALSRLGVREVLWVVGVCRDKDVGGILRELKHLDGSLTAVDIADARGLAAEELAAQARSLGHETRVGESASDALDAAVMYASGRGEGCAVVVCGSIFLLEAAYGWLGRMPFSTPPE